MSYVTAVVAVSTAVSQYSNGRYAKSMAGLEANQDEFTATQEKAAALETARLIRRAGRRSVGAADAAFSAAGVKVGEGSSLEVERGIYADSEHDAFQAILEGSNRSSALRLQAQLARIGGEAAKQAGIAGAVTTLGSWGASKGSGWKTTGNGLGINTGTAYLPDSLRGGQ